MLESGRIFKILPNFLVGRGHEGLVPCLSFLVCSLYL